MKRKVIQIANSTQLISLPRQWAKKHNIKKGDEIDVMEDGDRIVISTKSTSGVEKAEINISHLGEMTKRMIGSHYRAGIDEIRLDFDDPKMVQTAYEVIRDQHLVGVEIITQLKNSCTLRYVAGTMEEFDSVLRRTFLVLINMSEETIKALREQRYAAMSSISMLEQNNNRLTGICKRIINKTPGVANKQKLGPLYVIVEMLENIADHYKYLSIDFLKLDKKTKLQPYVLEFFAHTHEILRDFYTVYYDFSIEKIAKLKMKRNQMIDEARAILHKSLSPHDILVMHHGMSIVTKTFNMTEPYMVGHVQGKQN